MVEPFDMNPITKLWVTITNNSLVCQSLNECMKLTNNSNWIYVWLDGRWRYFLHSCIHERWIAQLVGIIFWYDFHMFAQEFFTKDNFLYHEVIISWEKQKMWIGVAT